MNVSSDFSVDSHLYVSNAQYREYAQARLANPQFTDSFEQWTTRQGPSATNGFAQGPEGTRSAVLQRKPVRRPVPVPQATAPVDFAAETPVLAISALIPETVARHIYDDATARLVGSYAQLLPEGMPAPVKEVGLMSLVVNERAFINMISDLMALGYVDLKALDALVKWLCGFKNAPTAPFPEKLGPDHFFAMQMVMVNWRGDAAKTDAQRVGLAPPEGNPTNKSMFNVRPITFEYDVEKYQRDWDYRFMVGERVLGMTEQTELTEWQSEVHRRVTVETQDLNGPPIPGKEGTLALTSGWIKNAGAVGVALKNEIPNQVPRLPEMHTNTFGEPIFEWKKMIATTRFPHARNWGTLEELVRFPLFLPRVDPAEFARAPASPEVLFTDRFGVTMRGVSQTPQCTRTTEHNFYAPRVPAPTGYDAEYASHGMTYEDYRRLYAGALEIMSRKHEDPKDAGRELKIFFYAASEHLRARGVPVVVKYKNLCNPPASTRVYLFSERFLFFRHQPLGIPMRTWKAASYKRAYPGRNL